MSLRPESSGMVSGAHSGEPVKSCSLSAFSPEPKDKPGLGEALACLEQTAAETAWAEDCAAPSLPQSPPFPGSLLPAEIVSVFRCLPPFSHLPGDLFLGLLPVSENKEASGELWIRSRIWAVMKQCRKMASGHLRSRRMRSTTGRKSGSVCSALFAIISLVNMFCTSSNYNFFKKILLLVILYSSHLSVIPFPVSSHVIIWNSI